MYSSKHVSQYCANLSAVLQIDECAFTSVLIFPLLFFFLLLPKALDANANRVIKIDNVS